MYLLPPSLPQQITGSESDMNIVVGAEVDPVEFDKQTEWAHKQINKQREPLHCWNITLFVQIQNILSLIC